MSVSAICRTNLISAASMMSLADPASPYAALDNGAEGVISTPTKDGVGSGRMSTGGAYTGQDDLLYKVRIDDVGAGPDLGDATFQWSDDDGGTWDASAVATASAAINLNNGVQVFFAQGPGDDFALGDAWRWKVEAPYGLKRLLDGDPATEFRTADVGTDTAILIDLGAAAEADTVILAGLNATGTVKLQANGTSATAWGSPSLDQTLTPDADGLVYQTFTAHSRRWWRVTFEGMSASDAHLALRHLWLGKRQSFPRPHADGYRDERILKTSRAETPAGYVAGAIEGVRRRWARAWEVFGTSDHDTVAAILEPLAAAGEAPFWFREGERGGTYLALLDEPPRFDHGARGVARSLYGVWTAGFREHL